MEEEPTHLLTLALRYVEMVEISTIMVVMTATLSVEMDVRAPAQLSLVGIADMAIQDSKTFAILFKGL